MNRAVRDALIVNRRNSCRDLRTEAKAHADRESSALQQSLE